MTLAIRFARTRDGHTALTCTRADGTTTWQHQRQGFFALHDLTHYAVETTLGLGSAFYGLLARGWNITDFGTPWPRGKIPADALDDAMLAESIVGMLDIERASGESMTADELNEWLVKKLAAQGMTLSRPVSDEELARIRSSFWDLRMRWAAVGPGEALELTFPVSVMA